MSPGLRNLCSELEQTIIQKTHPWGCGGGPPHPPTTPHQRREGKTEVRNTKKKGLIKKTGGKSLKTGSTAVWGWQGRSRAGTSVGATGGSKRFKGKGGEIIQAGRGEDTLGRENDCPQGPRMGSAQKELFENREKQKIRKPSRGVSNRLRVSLWESIATKVGKLDLSRGVRKRADGDIDHPPRREELKEKGLKGCLPSGPPAFQPGTGKGGGSDIRSSKQRFRTPEGAEEGKARKGKTRRPAFPRPNSSLQGKLASPPEKSLQQGAWSHRGR